MLISIIIPTYHAVKLLPFVLDSISIQSFKNYEVLILDNLSSDGTAALAEKYREKDKRIQIISRKDNGIYDAMDYGISIAKAEWVYFMGADDELFKENVLEFVSQKLNNENDIVYGDSVWMPENINEAGMWTNEIFINRNINHQRIFYRKSLFELYGGFKTKYQVAADYELNIRFFCNPSIRKLYLPLMIAKYHSGGFSAQKTDLAFWNDWDDIVLKNFKPYLSKKIIYGSIGKYIHYCIENNDKKKAFNLLLKHFKHTGSIGFLKLMLPYFLKTKTIHAS